MKFNLPKLSTFKNFFVSFWPIFALITIIFIAGIINYKPGTMLTGWDNLHPEFNLSLNIKRSIFAVWQEYQSLGLLGGMGHASDLVRQLILAILSPFVPMENLRYVWMITTLAIGSIGTYVFIKSLLVPYQDSRKNIYAFLGGLFYVFNLATIQTYYVAFEAFTSHFAFLPWLFWAVLSYVKSKTKRNLLILSAVALIATPAGYIPTLFVAFLIGISIVLFVLLLLTNARIKMLFSILKAYFVIFIINSFWLLPFLYFTFTNVNVNLNAKINQMATQNIFLQNKEFGDVFDVALLKGFWFNNVDPNLSGNFQFMLSPWKEHLNNPFVIAAGLIIFAIVLLGAVQTFRKRRPFHIAIFALFLFSFTMLATDTFPFSFFVGIFRDLPLFGQAFRFPFTKFSILTAFSYSLLFVLGLEFLAEMKEKISKRLTVFSITLLSLILIASLTFPVFTGHLFYVKEQLKLPQEYTQTFDYFKTQDPTARIADFPQQTFWGWQFYTWGYGGSGFLWYGIEQPILDRAFDVWSQTSENYYDEISYALYSQNPKLFLQVLNKYQVRFLLVDKNIYSPSSPKSLFYSQTDKLISQIPQIQKVKTFGKITIYKVSLQNKPKNFIYSTPTLPTANGYQWSDIDENFEKLGNYVNSKEGNNLSPIPTLFSNKLFDKDYSIKVTNSDIVISKTLPEISNASTLQITSFSSEKIVPVEISSQKNTSGNENIEAQVLFPKVYLGSTLVSDSTPIIIPLFVIPNANGDYTLDINGTAKFTINPEKPQKVRTYLQLDNDNSVVLSQNSGNITTQTITKEYLNSLPQLSSKTLDLKNIAKGTPFIISIPKVVDSYYSYAFKGVDFDNAKDCNAFRNGLTKQTASNSSLTLLSINDGLCSSVFAPTLPHEESYLINLKTQNEAGSTLHFWVLNDDNGYAPIDINLSDKKTQSYFVVPPMEQYGLAYSFHLDNLSTGNEKVENSIQSMDVFEIPYSFITGIAVEKPFTPQGTALSFESYHPNESLYIVNFQKQTQKSGPSTIVLSQSYDSGWKAYEVKKTDSKILNFLHLSFPFFFGKEVKTHVEVNNWENGWELNDYKLQTKNYQLIIVYLPQHLEYFGFFIFLTFIAFIIILNYKQKLRKIFESLNEYFELKADIFKNKTKMLL